MREVICSAIRNRHLLQFVYEGRTRVVEPHQLGLDKARNEALSAYWVSGYSESHELPRWRLYLVSEMADVMELNDPFEGPRPGYRRAPNQTIRSAISEL